MQVLIWSFEHNAWWGPGEHGYVETVDEAGRYSMWRAEQICLMANIPAINEAIVPLWDERAPAQRPLGVKEGRR